MEGFIFTFMCCWTFVSSAPVNDPTGIDSAGSGVVSTVNLIIGTCFLITGFLFVIMCAWLKELFTPHIPNPQPQAARRSEGGLPYETFTNQDVPVVVSTHPTTPTAVVLPTARQDPSNDESVVFEPIPDVVVQKVPSSQESTAVTTGTAAHPLSVDQDVSRNNWVNFDNGEQSPKKNEPSDEEDFNPRETIPTEFQRPVDETFRPPVALQEPLFAAAVVPQNVSNADYMNQQLDNQSTLSNGHHESEQKPVAPPRQRNTSPTSVLQESDDKSFIHEPDPKLHHASHTVTSISNPVFYPDDSTSIDFLENETMPGDGAQSPISDLSSVNSVPLTPFSTDIPQMPRNVPESQTLVLENDDLLEQPFSSSRCPQDKHLDEVATDIPTSVVISHSPVKETELVIDQDQASELADRSYSQSRLPPDSSVLAEVQAKTNDTESFLDSVQSYGNDAFPNTDAASSLPAERVLGVDHDDLEERAFTQSRQYEDTGEKRNTAEQSANPLLDALTDNWMQNAIGETHLVSEVDDLDERPFGNSRRFLGSDSEPDHTELSMNTQSNVVPHSNIMPRESEMTVDYDDLEERPFTQSRQFGDSAANDSNSAANDELIDDSLSNSVTDNLFETAFKETHLPSEIDNLEDRPFSQTREYKEPEKQNIESTIGQHPQSVGHIPDDSSAQVMTVETDLNVDYDDLEERPFTGTRLFNGSAPEHDHKRSTDIREGNPLLNTIADNWLHTAVEETHLPSEIDNIEERPFSQTREYKEPEEQNIETTVSQQLQSSGHITDNSTAQVMTVETDLNVDYDDLEERPFTGTRLFNGSAPEHDHKGSTDIREGNPLLNTIADNWLHTAVEETHLPSEIDNIEERPFSQTREYKEPEEQNIESTVSQQLQSSGHIPDNSTAQVMTVETDLNVDNDDLEERPFTGTSLFNRSAPEHNHKILSDIREGNPLLNTIADNWLHTAVEETHLPSEVDNLEERPFSNTREYNGPAAMTAESIVSNQSATSDPSQAHTVSEETDLSVDYDDLEERSFTHSRQFEPPSEDTMENNIHVSPLLSSVAENWMHSAVEESLLPNDVDHLEERPFTVSRQYDTAADHQEPSAPQSEIPNQSMDFTETSMNIELDELEEREFTQSRKYDASPFPASVNLFDETYPSILPENSTHSLTEETIIVAEKDDLEERPHSSTRKFLHDDEGESVPAAPSQLVEESNFFESQMTEGLENHGFRPSTEETPIVIDIDELDERPFTRSREPSNSHSGSKNVLSEDHHEEAFHKEDVLNVESHEQLDERSFSGSRQPVDTEIADDLLGDFSFTNTVKPDNPFADSSKDMDDFFNTTTEDTHFGDSSKDTSDDFDPFFSKSDQSTTVSHSIDPFDREQEATGTVFTSYLVDSVHTKATTESLTEAERDAIRAVDNAIDAENANESNKEEFMSNELQLATDPFAEADDTPFASHKSETVHEIFNTESETKRKPVLRIDASNNNNHMPSQVSPVSPSGSPSAGTPAADRELYLRSRQDILQTSPRLLQAIPEHERDQRIYKFLSPDEIWSLQERMAGTSRPPDLDMQHNQLTALTGVGNKQFSQEEHETRREHVLALSVQELRRLPLIQLESYYEHLTPDEILDVQQRLAAATREHRRARLRSADGDKAAAAVEESDVEDNTSIGVWATQSDTEDLRSPLAGGAKAWQPPSSRANRGSSGSSQSSVPRFGTMPRRHKHRQDDLSTIVRRRQALRSQLSTASRSFLSSIGSDKEKTAIGAASKSGSVAESDLGAQADISGFMSDNDSSLGMLYDGDTVPILDGMAAREYILDADDQYLLLIDMATLQSQFRPFLTAEEWDDVLLRVDLAAAAMRAHLVTADHQQLNTINKTVFDVFVRDLLTGEERKAVIKTRESKPEGQEDEHGSFSAHHRPALASADFDLLGSPFASVFQAPTTAHSSTTTSTTSNTTVHNGHVTTTTTTTTNQHDQQHQDTAVDLDGSALFSTLISNVQKAQAREDHMQHLTTGDNRMNWRTTPSLSMGFSDLESDSNTEGGSQRMNIVDRPRLSQGQRDVIEEEGEQKD